MACTTARCAGSLIGVNRKTAAYYFHRLREVIAYRLEQDVDQVVGGEIEADESYFGGRRKGKRGRGAAGKVPVFGLLKRGGRVYTKIIPDTRSATLMPIIARKVVPDSIVYTDGWQGYNALDVSDFKHFRINHSKQGNRASAPIANLVRRIDLAPSKIRISLDHYQLCEMLSLPATGSTEDIVIDTPITLKRRGIEAKLIIGGNDTLTTEPNAKLISAIASARGWFTELQTGETASVLELAGRHGVDRSHISRTLQQAFLAPDIVRAIVEGRIDSDLTLSRLKRLKLPASWQAQGDLLRIQ